MSTAMALESKWRDISESLYSLPQPRAPFSSSPSFPPLSSHLGLLLSLFGEQPRVTPLTCRRSAILGPLAANPETCTWEAEGALRSPNQPSFLKEWETRNKWRRGGRRKENIAELRERTDNMQWPGEGQQKGEGVCFEPEAEAGRGLAPLS